MVMGCFLLAVPSGGGFWKAAPSGGALDDESPAVAQVWQGKRDGGIGTAGGGLLADGLEGGSLGIDHEGGVVGGAVVGPQARRAVVGSAVGQGGGMKRIHRFVGGGVECQV